MLDPYFFIFADVGEGFDGFDGKILLATREMCFVWVSKYVYLIIYLVPLVVAFIERISTTFK